MTDKQRSMVDNLLALLRIILNILMCICILGIVIYFLVYKGMLVPVINAFHNLV